MRILIVNHYAIPPSEVGGTRHMDIARELVARGHQVTIISADFNHFSLQHHVRGPSKQNFDGVTLIRLRTPSYQNNSIQRLWNMLCFSGQLFSKRRKLQREINPDIVIGSSPHLFAALAAKILASYCKKPFVLEVRDLWPETLIALSTLSAKHPLCRVMQVIEKHLYKTSAHIITLLPGSGNYIQDKGITSEKITYIPNGTRPDPAVKPRDDGVVTLSDDEAVKPRDDGSAHTHGDGGLHTHVDGGAADGGVHPHGHGGAHTHADHGRFTILYAGSHGLANCLETVLLAAKQLLSDKNFNWAERIRIILIGDGPEKKELQHKAKLWQLNPIIEFRDAVPKSEIYDILSCADAFLMLLKDSPLFAHGISPNKLFDYMLMAKPTIFGVSTSHNPIKEANAGITIPSEDPKALAQAIKELSQQEPNKLATMGSNARDYVLQYHTIPVITDKLEPLLNKLSLTKPLEASHAEA